jgi:hypothetical protein
MKEKLILKEQKIMTQSRMIGRLERINAELRTYIKDTFTKILDKVESNRPAII